MNFFVISGIFFSQILSLQLLVYPFVILSTLYFFFIKNYKFDVNILFSIILYLIVLTYAYTSLRLRDASLDYVIHSLRFFFGIGIVFFFFKFSNFEINKKHIILLVSLIIYESLSMTLFKFPPLYWYLSISDIPFMMERTRIDIISGYSFYAALGPSLNSSISSVVSVIIFFILLKNNNKILISLAFISVFLYTSLSGYIALFILLFFINTENISYKVKIFIFFVILVLFIFSSSNFLGFSNLETIVIIINEKIQSILSLSSFDILFGVGLSNYTPEMIGGDFIILSFIQSFGLILFFIFSLWLITSSSKKNLIFVLLGLFMSIHYGVIFSLTGQVFFAALMANKINFKK